MGQKNEKKKSFLFSLKFWLTTSILGLIVVGVTTNFLYDLIKTLHTKLSMENADAFRFRYFILDVDSDLLSGDQTLLQTLFESKQKVYVSQNDVYKILKYIDNNSAMITNFHNKEFIAAKQYYTIDEFLSSLSESDRYEKHQSGQFKKEPIYEYSVHSKCSQFLNRGLLGHDEIAKKFARDNSDRSDFFSSRFFDRRYECAASGEEYPQFEENSYSLPVKLLIVDIENVSDLLKKGIKIEQTMYLSDNRNWKLYDDFSYKEHLKSKTVVNSFPINVLTPHEHLLIPMCILFERPNSVTDQKKKLIRNNFNWPNSPIEVSYYELNFQDTARSYYFFGPVSVPKTIYYSNNKKVSFRDFNFENLTYTIAGIPVGSCPFIYIYDSAKKEWINKGKILVNATGKTKERTDVMIINNFNGLLMIKEVENEVSYLDWLEVEIEKNDGQKIHLIPKQLAFKKMDETYVILQKGEYIVLDFRPIEKIKNAKVIVTGYYMKNEMGRLY